MLQARKTAISWTQAQWQDFENRGLQLEHYAVFESADQQAAWYGFGAVATFTPTSATTAFQEVATWLAGLQQELATTALRQDLAILGGFAFTTFSQQHNAWGDLANGYFILPRFLVKRTSTETALVELTRNNFASDDSLVDFEKFLPMVAAVQVTNGHLNSTEQAAVWQQAVQQVVQRLQTDPHLQKVVLARTLQVTNTQPFSNAHLLRALRQTQTAVYHLVLKVADQLFISATPERLVAVTGKRLATAAVAGTAARAADLQVDTALGAALLHDQKNRVEQQIVVQEIQRRLQPLVTNLVIPAQPQLLKSQQVQHLYTPITAQLRPTVDLFKVVAALHPTPALGGQPSVSALPLIRQLESEYRGLFGAPFGYVTFAGDGEFAVAIRSMLVQQRQALLFAGAGIVAASQPAAEVRETALKFQPMLQLLQQQVGDISNEK
ncbi:isochorismate synthase [Loigolactobacillus zhaoyuanensis]|uniref:isochorismate synthase n=1 Tax=Loigolactobacillus zhaoyuanensis TaxID=2486017 RepID=A0ABW8UE26_9LACO